MKKILALTAVILLLSFVLHLVSCSSPDYSLTINNKTIKIEVADTEELKTKGLMFRESLPDDSGMLFMYPQEDIRYFWMKNTPLPLSIAFIASTGIIVDIQDMKPYNLETISSSGPAQYALEMNQGWFKKNNIKAGDRVVFSAGVKKRQANLSK